MAAKGGQSGVATEVAQQAAERIHGAASWLEQREPADLLQAVRDFARRRPGVFLARAAVAGLAAGRLTRGMTDAARSDRQQGMQRPPRDIPSGAMISPPPDPDWITPMPGYPSGHPRLGHHPALVKAGQLPPTLSRTTRLSGVPGRRRRRARPARPRRGVTTRTPVTASYQGSGYDEGAGLPRRPAYPDSGPETYRPGQQP